MPPNRAERQRQATLAEIKSVARNQMAQQGEASLSLNAIARAMGMTPPALYRYFDSREALITALIIDAFTALGDDLQTAHESGNTTHSAHYAQRFNALAQAYRAWAITNPHDYSLIYGTPLPGYHAPAELTVPVASRILTIFGLFFKDAWEAGHLTLPLAYNTLPSSLKKSALAAIGNLSKDKHAPAILMVTLSVRARLHGLVWAELHHQFPPGLAEDGHFYTLELAAISDWLQLDTSRKN